MPTSCWNTASMMPDPDDLANAEKAASAARREDVGQARTVFGAEGAADLLQLGARDVAAKQLGEHAGRLLFAAFRDEVTRAFRDHEQGDEEDRCRERLHQEHPAPCLDAEPERRGRHARARGEEVIDEERGGKAGDDHDLLDGREPAADFRRSDFGNVGRRKDACRADRHSAADSRDQEDEVRVRETLDQRTDKEERGRDHHRVAAAHDVGEPAGKEGADEAADQQRGDGEAEAVGRRPAAGDQAERLA